MESQVTDTQTPVQRNGIIIFDLDGCVSDDRRRRSMLPATTINQTEGELDYSYYHMGLSEDPVLPHAMARIQDAQNNAAFIFFITARPISLFKESSEWIERNLGLARDLDYQLCMRPLGDTRPSPPFPKITTPTSSAHSMTVGMSSPCIVLAAFPPGSSTKTAPKRRF
jgi:hypothetical protein